MAADRSERAAWFPASWPGWHYPDPEHPSSADFPFWHEWRSESGCGLCGAPIGARCVTRRGHTASNHRARHKPKESDDA